MSKTPYSQQKDARQQNTSALLRDLWRHEPLSKATLAQRNGLTKATVSAICTDLTTLNLIRTVGQNRGRLGRPGRLLELNPSARCAIGVEISTNYSAVVLTDLCGMPLWERADLIPVGGSQETVLCRTEALIVGAVDQARELAIPLLGLGVGVPGIVNPGPESLVSAPALGWKDVPLKQIWKQRFALPVIVENKARAAAMAEALHGNAQNVASFVYISMGTDVGSSIEAAVVTNGFPHRGFHGLAVDAGHMILDPQGPLCVCGQRGCWQAMVDVKREVELARPRLAAGEASVLQRFVAEDDSALFLEHRAIHQAALEGDALALDVFRTVQLNHALGLINLVRLFDPEMVVIGWASAALPEAFHARMAALNATLGVPEAVRQALSRRGADPPAIVYAAHGSGACMLGAAALLVDEYLRTPPTIGD
jgi:predicted NBD/HSP70 family sugar kinase